MDGSGEEPVPGAMGCPTGQSLANDRDFAKQQRDFELYRNQHGPVEWNIRILPRAFTIEFDLREVCLVSPKMP